MLMNGTTCNAFSALLGKNRTSQSYILLALCDDRVQGLRDPVLALLRLCLAEHAQQLLDASGQERLEDRRVEF